MSKDVILSLHMSVENRMIDQEVERRILEYIEDAKELKKVKNYYIMWTVDSKGPIYSSIYVEVVAGDKPLPPQEGEDDES